MAIKYKIVKHAQPGVKGGGKYKYYLRSAGRKKLDINDTAKILEKRSSISRADIVAVLTGFTDLIPELLLENYSIKLGELGTFSSNIKSSPSDTFEEASTKKIKEVKISFRVGKLLQKAMKGVSFKKQG